MFTSARFATCFELFMYLSRSFYGSRLQGQFIGLPTMLDKVLVVKVKEILVLRSHIFLFTSKIFAKNFRPNYFPSIRYFSRRRTIKQKKYQLQYINSFAKVDRIPRIRFGALHRKKAPMNVRWTFRWKTRRKLKVVHFKQISQLWRICVRDQPI